MKLKSKALFATLAGFIICLVTACTQSSDKSYAVVQGKWIRGKDDKVSLLKITHGRIDEVTSYNLEDDGSFALAVPVTKESFYVLGSGNPAARQNKYAVYLKAGDEVNIEVNDTTYVLTGENSSENTALEKWHNFVYPIEAKSYYSMLRRGLGLTTYVDFFPLLNEKLEELKSTKFGGTQNPVFEKAFNEYRQIDLLSIAVAYLYMPHTAHPEKEDFIDYYRNINLDALSSDTQLFNYPFGTSLLSQLVFTVQKLTTEVPDRDFTKFVKNDTLIGELYLRDVGRLKSYRSYVDFEKERGKYILTEDQKARLEGVKLKLAQGNKEGQPAIDFTYPDINGKNVSLSGMQGKVVVIDVWATWCGPCKAQIPALKKLEVDYHNKDVVFLSVSIDEEKDKQKWTDFVKKEELKGVQLFAGGWGSDIAKYYGIRGIPRFMVVGKDGNLVSIDAPRPSTPDLKKMIDVELKK
ncbi:MAG: TlpA family protein disulfide reductase [Draconibacterium sp.]